MSSSTRTDNWAIGHGTESAKPRLRFLSRPRLLLGTVLLISIISVAVFAGWVAPYDPIVQSLPDRLQSPSVNHWFGTDKVGRDVLSRVIYGSRISLVVGLGTVFLAGTIGVTIGLAGGYYGGWIEMILMRLTDVQLAFPVVLLAIVVVGFMGASTQNLVLVLATAGWVDYSRVLYARTLSLKEREFVIAARCIGATDTAIIFRHILSNVWSPIVVVSTFQMARMILAEAALTFLGLGVQPPAPSWGAMLSDGRDLLVTAPWLAIFPGLAIVLTVFVINLVGDGLQRVLSGMQ